LAEIIKSVLLSNKTQWSKLRTQPVNDLLQEPLDGLLWKRLISLSLTFKVNLVKIDFREGNIRKALNFGHTIGHALESHSFIKGKQTLLHGDAIAAGMICAARLSHLKTGLNSSQMQEILDYLSAGFPHIPILPDEIPAILNHMKYDKKNQQGQLRFTLLSAPGSFKTNVACESAEVSEVLINYLPVMKPAEL
jgi:3-dehydroquinate synthase